MNVAKEVFLGAVYSWKKWVKIALNLDGFTLINYARKYDQM